MSLLQDRILYKNYYDGFFYFIITVYFNIGFFSPFRLRDYPPIAFSVVQHCLVCLVGQFLTFGVSLADSILKINYNTCSCSL